MISSIESMRVGGTGIYMGLTGSAYLFGGVTASIGLVQDGKGHVETYFTFGGGLGLGVSGGFEAGEIIPTDPNHTFTTSEFRGTGVAYSLGEGFLGGSMGGHLVINIKVFKIRIIFYHRILGLILQMAIEQGV